MSSATITFFPSSPLRNTVLVDSKSREGYRAVHPRAHIEHPSFGHQTKKFGNGQAMSKMFDFQPVPFWEIKSVYRSSIREVDCRIDLILTVYLHRGQKPYPKSFTWSGELSIQFGRLPPDSVLLLSRLWLEPEKEKREEFLGEMISLMVPSHLASRAISRLWIRGKGRLFGHVRQA